MRHAGVERLTRTKKTSSSRLVPRGAAPGALGVVDCLWPGIMHIVAFTLYLIVVFPGGAPVVTNAGTWRNASDCRAAADSAFVPQNSQGQSPSFSFVCVPRSSLSSYGPR